MSISYLMIALLPLSLLAAPCNITAPNYCPIGGNIPTQSLPDNWNTASIGNPPPGAYTNSYSFYDNTTDYLRIVGGGGDIFKKYDAFYFIWKTTTDLYFRFQMKLTDYVYDNVNAPWCKVGPMFRGSLNTLDNFFMAAQASHDNGTQGSLLISSFARNIQSGNSFAYPDSTVGVNSFYANYHHWIRITKEGNIFYSEFSQDNITWFQVFQTNFSFVGEFFYYGIAASPNNQNNIPLTASVDFSSIQVIPYCKCSQTGNFVCVRTGAPPSNQCQCQVGWAGSNCDQYIAGQTATASSNSSNSSSFPTNNQTQTSGLQQSSNRGSMVGVVAGSAIGGVVLLVGIVVLAVILTKRRVKRDDFGPSITLQLDRYDGNPTTVYSKMADDSKNRRSHSSLHLNIYDIESTLNNTPISRRSSSKNISDTWNISYKDIIIEEEIGRGAFGVVYSGKWRRQDVAVKQLISTALDSQHMKSFLDEAALMSTLRPHDNVIQLLGICTEPLCIITRYYSNGNLLNYLNEPHEISFQMKMKLLKGITAGMLHLETENMVHRDLATRNILLNSQMEPVVADFGFARTLVSRDDAAITATNIGPIRWMAPESLFKQEYSSKSDVWSWGVTAFEILTRSYPYGAVANSNVILAVSKGLTKEHLQLPESSPFRLVMLIQQCWISDPALRPNFQQIFSSLEIITREA